MNDDDPTSDDVDAMRRLHRLASGQVDGRPRADVRDAVLAAAARAVDAKPDDASRRRSFSPFGARRWPFPVAALMVVTLMTGLIATEAMRDHPERVTSAASAPTTDASAGRVRDAAPAAPAPFEPDREASQPSPAPIAPAREQSDPSSRQRAAAAPRRPPETAKPAPDRADAESAVPSPVRPSRPQQPPAAPSSESQAPSAPAPREPRRDAGDERREAVAEERAVDASPKNDAALASTGAASLRRRAVEPSSPEAWVERIVGLRAAGDDAGADREVAALRARYPGFEVPASALRPTGTR